MRRFFPALFVLTLTAFGFMAGCSGSSTEPIEVPLVFEGEIAFQGRKFHNFTVVSTGTVRIELVRLQEKVADGAEPLGLNLSIGLGLGRPTADQCPTRYSVQASEGELAVFELSGAEFCVLLFDAGSLLPGQVVEYTVLVSSG